MRKFIIDGEEFTTYSYGLFMLKKTFEESCRTTIDPDEMTKQEIEEWGLDFILEQMNEREDIEEVK